MRSMVRMLVRVKAGIYTARLRRYSVDIVESDRRCRPRRNRDAVAIMSIVSKNRDVYTGYILVAKHSDLKLINCAIIVKCTITCDTLSNSLMVEKHRQKPTAIHLTTFKNCASLLRVQKTL